MQDNPRLFINVYMMNARARAEVCNIPSYIRMARGVGELAREVVYVGMYSMNEPCIQLASGAAWRRKLGRKRYRACFLAREMLFALLEGSS